MYIAVKITYQHKPNPYYTFQNRMLEPETINEAVKDYIILHGDSVMVPGMPKRGYTVYKIAPEIKLQVVETITHTEAQV